MKPWAECHALLLRQGYGVEDIAVRLNCTAERVRREVARLRANGKLADVLAVKRAEE
ncbi:MAG: hypothetical protein ACRC14_04765 [Paracoccaceae bacterium]